MPTSMPLGSTALSLFGKLLEPYLVYLDSIKSSLKKAGIKTPILEYISCVALYSLIGFMAAIIGGSVIISLSVALASNASLTANTFYSFTLSIIISFAAAAGIFGAGLYYPSMKMKTIRSKI